MASIKPPGEAEPHALTLRVDYRIPLGMLYRDLAKAMMFNFGAYLLLATDATFGKQKDLVVPSWTPDFGQTVKCMLHGSDQLLPKTDHSAVFKIADDQRSIPFRLPLDQAVTSRGAVAKSPARAKIRARAPLFPDRDFLKFTACDMITWSPPGTWFTENGLAVPIAAETGDIVVWASTAGVPVVLRASPQCPEKFSFVGCASFLTKSWREKGDRSYVGSNLMEAFESHHDNHGGFEDMNQVFEIV
ncbi:hypothetical protein LTR37_007672 [Vermiconidia calcicola]|uniref:Uncharacterized protein n=1 Tax=Vermiconidia calcicola TaxID=1690605 RepID=A0ACC3ND88_9PEZI|nr:hypothetical protein LTR37_007672 [Vermiconidia calcicola]